MGNCQGAVGGTPIARQAPFGNDNPEALAAYTGSGPHFTCDPKGEIPPRMARSGLAGPECPATTLMALLTKVAEVKGDKDALLVERPLPPLGADGKAPPPLPREEWTKWTFKEYLRDVRRVGKAFAYLGMQPFESVNIWGFNSPEWFISAIGAMFAGGKCAGLYPTDTADTAAYKVVHSQGAICVAEDRKKVDLIAKALSAEERKDCKRLKAFVVYGSEPPAGDSVEVVGLGKVPVYGWQALLKIGDEKGSDEEVDKRVVATKPGHCATLIYTSGTTGMPKAVMISHDSLVYEGFAVLGVIGRDCGYCTTASEERVLSYLPLSHVAGMMVDMVTQISAGAMKPAWVSVFFARPYDLKAKAIKDRLGVAQPTLFLGVPLVWEKIADQIRSIGAAGSAVQKSIGTWAKGVALQHAVNCQLGGSGAAPMGHGIAMKLLGKIKSRLGLASCKYGLSGAAPIRKDTLEYFGSLGLFINEAYGMSECTGAATMSTDSAHIWGSCGFAVPGVEVKTFLVDPTDISKKKECPHAPNIDCSTEEKYQGELCYRGRNIMMGYLGCPDFGAAHTEEINKKTAEAIDSEGWLHSGDKGMITESGFAKITGRYKELIIGEGGENIAPVPIEDEVKRACDGIAEVMMVGDKRKFCIALVTLKAVGANGEVPGTDDLDAGAARVNPDVTTISAAISDKVWIEAVTNAIKAANGNGKVCPNNSFKIQKFCILPTNFSEEMGELTPTKKLKRKQVETAYAAIIEKIYATDGMYFQYTK